MKQNDYSWLWLFHVLAFFFFFPAIFLTAPLHIILNSMAKKKVAKSEERDGPWN